jgi:hypothetical protein
MTYKQQVGQHCGDRTQVLLPCSFQLGLSMPAFESSQTTPSSPQLRQLLVNR